jgi:hypothetical protein
LAVSSPENELQRALGHFDEVDKPAGGAVNVDLAGGEVNIAARVHRYTLAALFGEQAEVA